ncbi:MAG: hypothetical protein PHT50_00630 [Candidatus Omnitrophica bacterium]|nr:hypothetical protein [Candidatus Omnitrophota bacterium]
MRYKRILSIWVEKLGMFDFIWLFIETFFSRIPVRYDEKKISGIAAFLIGKLQSYGCCKNFYMAKLTLDKKDVIGYALNYRKENDLDICLSKFCQRYIPKEPERFKSAVKVYISFYLAPYVTFITMVEGSDKFKQDGGINVIYLAKHPLTSVIKKYYRDKGYSIRESGLSFGYVNYFLIPCCRLFSIVVKRLFQKRGRTNIHEPKPSVWLEYLHYGRCSFPFNHDVIDRKKFDIVCYLDRNDGVSLEDEIRAIEDMGLKWVDLRSGSLVRLANIGVWQLWDMFCTFLSAYSSSPFWFRVFRFEFRMFYLLYKAVFSRFKVKVLIEHQEGSWVKEPQMIALEEVGGIMLGYHWSNFPFYKEALMSHPQHVYFVWGKVMYERMQKRGNIARHVLPVGIWLGPSVEDVSAICMKDDLRFIMAIFDSTVAYNIHQSEETLARFYLKVLEMLEENSEWGGIIKSKIWGRINDLESLPFGKDIVSKAMLLINQRRLVFLNNKVSPITAAAYANISVCYGLNSAGIISGIYGHRAIHWDLSGFLHYPIYRDPEQKIFFKNLEEIVSALNRVSTGDTRIGDFSKWKDVFNYFGDFKGQSRISEFIRIFMEDVVVSRDPIKSLDLAAERYKKVNNIESAFFINDGLWEDERGGDCELER